MTPEERAARVTIRVGCGCCSDDDDEKVNAATIAAAIRQAIAEEREACAEIADDATWHCAHTVGPETDYPILHRHLIAAAIRARG